MTYIAISLNNIREPLSYPAVSIADREPTRGLRVHYCYSIALQNGGKYAENRILSSIIYGPRPRRQGVYRIKLFQLDGWIISHGYYLMIFHSRLSYCEARICGQCLINSRQLHDVRRKGRGGSLVSCPDTCRKS